jgi:hypothetical protein
MFSPLSAIDGVRTIGLHSRLGNWQEWRLGFAPAAFSGSNSAYSAWVVTPDPRRWLFRFCDSPMPTKSQAGLPIVISKRLKSRTFRLWSGFAFCRFRFIIVERQNGVGEE